MISPFLIKLITIVEPKKECESGDTQKAAMSTQRPTVQILSTPTYCNHRQLSAFSNLFLLNLLTPCYLSHLFHSFYSTAPSLVYSSLLLLPPPAL